MDYSKSSFLGIRAGINRHLNSPPYNKNINIVYSPKFASSIKMFNAVLKSKAGDSKYFSSISLYDIEKINDPKAFNINDPLELQQKVFFNIVQTFSLGGSDILQSLKKSSFVFKVDESNGCEYCELSPDVPTKSIPESVVGKISKTVRFNLSKTKIKPRLYATGQPNCALFSLKKYLSKLNQDPNCTDFFVRRKYGQHFNPEIEQCWYTTKPLGKNNIGFLMRNISIRLGLSCLYRNSSIRKSQLICGVELG